MSSDMRSVPDLKTPTQSFCVNLGRYRG